jgi:protein SCO1
MKFWLSIVLSLCVTAVGFFALSAGTHDFTVWTEEGERRWSALNHPASLPAFEWLNQDRKSQSLSSLNKPIVLLDFVYTRCLTVCQLMGYELKQVQQTLSEEQLQDSVELLSLSFDPEYDTPEKMGAYLQRHKAEPGNWQAGVIEARASLSRLLDQLGVVVLPDGSGGFVHNAAFYLIYEGTLVSIHDQDQLPKILKSIKELHPTI